MMIDRIIAIVSTAAAVLFAYLAYIHNKKHDDQSDAAVDASILTEIVYIKANTDEIKSEQKEQRKANLEFITRLSAAETNIKNLSERIEKIEEKVNG